MTERRPGPGPSPGRGRVLSRGRVPGRGLGRLGGGRSDDHSTAYVVEDSDPWGRVQLGVVALGAVLTAGTGAYRLLGLGWLEAFYQTVITVTTVGYGEITPPSGEITGAYRLVTSVLVLVGVSVGVYTFGVFFEALIEGRLTTHLERIRMQRDIATLNDHIVICGFGQVGQAIAESIRIHGQQVVVVDSREDIHDHGELYTIRGDATEDEVLLAAGLERARGLVTALDTDADNLFVVITARQIKPSLHIVARANEASSIKKLVAGGADRVVNPHRIGGARMASFMVQPNVADFVGESMSDAQYEVRLAELTVTPGSPLDDRSIGASGVRDACGITILAIRRGDHGFVHQPSGATVTRTGDVIIALGTPEQHEAFTAWMTDPGTTRR